MTEASATSEVPKPQRWAEGDLLVLFCALNQNINEIRIEFESEKKAGVALASEILSKTIGNGCTPARVKNKIENVWTNARPETPGLLRPPSDPMYLFGAYSRTLPGLDLLYPGMLQRIALAGKLQNYRQQPEKASSRVGYSLRPNRYRANDDPIECGCGFSHYASSCVHCSNCRTWQHIWCYYKTDSLDDPPDDYACERCTQGQTGQRITSTKATLPIYGDDDLKEDFVEAIQRLQVESHRDEMLTTKRGGGQLKVTAKANGKESVLPSPSRLFDEDEMFYGLQDDDIQGATLIITSSVKTIAHSLHTDDFQLGMLSGNGATADVKRILPTGALATLRKKSRSQSDNVQLLGTIIGSAIWNWTFYADGFGAGADRIKSRSDIILDEYRKTPLPQNVLSAVRVLHQKAWTSLTTTNSDLLKPIIQEHADRLARRLLSMLSSIVKRSQESLDSRPLKTPDDWINSTKSGPQRYKLIVNVFIKCIKLKDKLPQSGFFYEIYYPSPLEHCFIEGRPETGEEEIEYYLSPAIIEYPPEMFQVTGMGMDALFGDQNFIRATETQRSCGRVVSLAVVTLH